MKIDVKINMNIDVKINIEINIETDMILNKLIIHTTNLTVLNTTFASLLFANVICLHRLTGYGIWTRKIFFIPQNGAIRE